MTFRELLNYNPKRDVAFTAIDKLKEEDEIRRFFHDYIRHLRENGNEKKVRDNPYNTARGNISYILGYYSGIDDKLWHKIINEEPFTSSANKMSFLNKN